MLRIVVMEKLEDGFEVCVHAAKSVNADHLIKAAMRVINEKPNRRYILQRF